MSFALEDAGYWNSPEQCDAANEIVTLRAQIEKLTKERDEYRLKYQIKAEKSDTYSREASAQEDMIEFATEYALSIAPYLHQHFFDDVPQWRPLDDLIGLQTQISNMVTGIGEQLAALAEQNEKMKADRSSVWMVATKVCMMLFATKDDADQSQQGASTYTVPVEVPVFGAQLPDLATPVLNRIKAEGMREAAEICKKENYWIKREGVVDAIRSRADELEKQNG